MKALLIAIVVLVMGDLVINQGEFTHATMQGMSAFCHWLAGAGSDSIFSR